MQHYQQTRIVPLQYQFEIPLGLAKDLVECRRALGPQCETA